MEVWNQWNRGREAVAKGKSSGLMSGADSRVALMSGTSGLVVFGVR